MQMLLGPMIEREIAEELDLSHYYIHDVVKSIYRKMKVQSRTELMALFLGTNPTPRIKKKSERPLCKSS